jgi:hypothetical protein
MVIVWSVLVEFVGWPGRQLRFATHVARVIRLLSFDLCHLVRHVLR